MYQRKHEQLFFFDMIYDKLIPADHFLRKLHSIINWDRIETHLTKLHTSAKGRPAYNPLMMVKTLLLQFLYDLSDRQLEEHVNDRISFRYFLGIDPTDKIPDHTNYCRFRDSLGEETIAALFNDVVEQSRAKGFVKDRLCIVDATHVRARVDTFRMTTTKSNDASGEPPSQVDPDATHGYKSPQKPFFGYKVGIGVDNDSAIVTQVTATTGKDHDSTHFSAVADSHARAVTADKGYDTPENFQLLNDHHQTAAIIVKHRKGKHRGHIKACYPNKTAYQKYYYFKRFRPAVEKVFATAKQWYGLARARYWGLAKMKIQALMTMMAINLKRMVTLETCLLS